MRPPRPARASAARSARFASALVLAASAVELASGGCDKPSGSAWSCACVYLSDTDQSTHQAFTVCAVNKNEAVVTANGCQGPGTVDSCKCEPAREGTPCRSGCSR